MRNKFKNKKEKKYVKWILKKQPNISYLSTKQSVLPIAYRKEGVRSAADTKIAI